MAFFVSRTIGYKEDMGRFNSLHNFDLSGLKWGNQKVIRYVKATDHSNAYVNFDLSDLKWGRQKILICIKEVHTYIISSINGHGTFMQYCHYHVSLVITLIL